jgi:DNA helicase-2/ATP-dependent DNA helicase PcrA
MKLSSEKIAIIKTNQQNIKVESGPGAGKTTLLVNYIDQRLREGVDPSRILVLMFTNSTQKQFVGQLNKQGIKNIKVNTIHAYGYQLYSKLCQLNLLQSCHVGSINDIHIQRCYREILNSANELLVNSPYRHISKQLLENFYTFITLKRNQDFAISTNGISHFTALNRINNPLFESAYSLLNKEQSDVGIIPINEVVAKPAEYFSKPSWLRDEIQGMYDYILVDEGQDLSEMDFAMINNHIGSNTKLVIAGDEKQSINEFRGANHNIFKNLDVLLPDVINTKLISSFRFSSGLSNLAFKLFGTSSNNDGQSFVKENTYASIEIERYFDQRHPLIKNLISTKNLDESCLILREKNAFPVYELLLLDNDIDFNLGKNRPFVFHKPITMLLGYLLLASGRCITSLPFELQISIVKSLLYTPYPQAQPEISQWLLSKLPSVAYEMLTTLKKGENESSALGNVPLISEVIRKGFTAKSSVAQILNTLTGFKCMNPLFNTTTAILNQSSLSQVRLLDFFKKTNMSVERLFELVDKSLSNKNNNGLKVMTMHEAKGAEFSSVYVGALYDGIMPLIRTESDKSESAIEAEKRLLYVAMTRAIDKLTLLCPVENKVSHIQYSESGTYFLTKTSRFIDILTKGK